MCLTHQNGQCYQCAFEKTCGGEARILTCRTMKKTEYDRKVAEKTSEIQDKIDAVYAQIIDKQNAYIEFIKVCFRIHDHMYDDFSFKTDPQRSVDDSLSELIELNANYVAKYETESQIRLRLLEKRLEAQRIESSSQSSTQSNSESVSKSNLDLSQELESVGNLFHAKRRKMQERIMRFVRFKNLWTSFRSKTSASSPDWEELYQKRTTSKKVVYLNGDH